MRPPVTTSFEKGKCDRLPGRRHPAAPAPSFSGSLFIRDDQRAVLRAFFRYPFCVLVGGINPAEITDFLSHPLCLQDARHLFFRDRVRKAGNPVSLSGRSFYLITVFLQLPDIFPDSCTGNAQLPAEILSGNISPGTAEHTQNLIFIHISYLAQYPGTAQSLPLFSAIQKPLTNKPDA